MSINSPLMTCRDSARSQPRHPPMPPPPTLRAHQPEWPPVTVSKMQSGEQCKPGPARYLPTPAASFQTHVPCTPPPLSTCDSPSRRLGGEPLPGSAAQPLPPASSCLQNAQISPPRSASAPRKGLLLLSDSLAYRSRRRICCADLPTVYGLPSPVATAHEFSRPPPQGDRI